MGREGLPFIMYICGMSYIGIEVSNHLFPLIG